jgi:hypothetical protein
MSNPLTARQLQTAKQGEKASRRRRQWERGTGEERMRDIRDIVGVPKPDRAQGPGIHGEGRGGYSRSQMWAVENWPAALEEGMDPSHLVHDDQPHLPGLENREAAPLSAIDRASKRGAERWEDLGFREREDISRRVKAGSGATLESMTRAYGSQLDQAMIRASDRGQMPPQFYAGGEPHEVVSKTATDLGVSRGTVAALHADNSPQTKFSVGGQTSPRRYPQDEMARAAVASARRRGSQVQDMDPYQLKRDAPPGAMGYASNFAKSVRRADQVVNQGIPAGETNPNLRAAGFGPKVGPYQRAWTGGTSSQFVSDVHSGGGGMVPHLGTRKVETGSSEREEAIQVSGFHLMADKAAREAHRQRGGHFPVKRGQEVQWVEEQIQRPDMPQTEERVYGPGHVERDMLTGRPSRRPRPADPRQLSWDI